LLFFNWLNPAAAKGNSLQGAADQLSLRRAVWVLTTAVADTAGAPADVAFDAARVGFLGHSQGANVGALAMALEPQVGAAVFSGAGGGLLDSLADKTTPYLMANIVRLLLADPSASDFRVHPALSLIQGYLDDIEPTNYGRQVTVAPLPGSVAKNLLQIVGLGDTYAPNRTAKNLAYRWAPEDRDRLNLGIYVGGTGTDFLGATDPVATPPVKENFNGPSNIARTVVVSVHAPSPGNDGHFVLFDDPVAERRAVAFLSDFLADPTTPPTVIP